MDSTCGVLSGIGPQRAGDSPLARRVRFHQSWYRAVVLNRGTFGFTSGSRPQALGSILTDADARAGMNFTSTAARRLFHQRHAEGWGLDPTRCTKYLTSSQALMLNMIGLLVESPTWAARLLRKVLNRDDIEAVKWIEVEYAPRRRSAYLRDGTRLDVLVMIATPAGEQLVVIEIKYCDRFNSRRVDINTPEYRQLASECELWVDADRVLETSELNQLVRCHALAAAVSKDVSSVPKMCPSLVVLHHDGDDRASDLVAQYATELAEPLLARNVSLNRFVQVLSEQAQSKIQKRVARDLELRYVDEEESECAWNAWRQSVRR